MRFGKELGIDTLVEIIPMKRDDLTHSHPKRILEELVTFWQQALRNGDVVFSPEIDSVCLIADRDKKSFSDDQYDSVLKLCTQNSYRTIISNPCFEFWLLLHRKDVSDIPQEKVLKNEKQGDKTYVEHLLNTACDGHYRKNRIQFSAFFKDGLFLAIEQAKRYATDPEALKDHIGTNVGLLVEEMMKS